MKNTRIAIALLFASSACAYAAEPTSAQAEGTKTQIIAGFVYDGDMDVAGGSVLTIYPGKDILRGTPVIANNGGVIIVRNNNDVPRIIGLREPEADGSEANSCKGYLGIGVFNLSQVRPEQEQYLDDEPYTAIKGTLVSATDIRVMRSECTGSAAEQKLLVE